MHVRQLHTSYIYKRYSKKYTFITGKEEDPNHLYTWKARYHLATPISKKVFRKAIKIYFNYPRASEASRDVTNLKHYNFVIKDICIQTNQDFKLTMAKN